MRNKVFSLLVLVAALLSGCSDKSPYEMTDTQLLKCKYNAFSDNDRKACDFVLKERKNPTLEKVKIPPSPKPINFVNQSIGMDWVKIDKQLSFKKEYTSNESLTAWVKVAGINKKYAYAMSKWTVNCRYKNLQIGETIFYSKNGVVVDSVTEPAPAQSIVPESNGEMFYNINCRS